MQNKQNHIILVDGNDTETGTMEKMEAHQKGLLHRAFSVCIFNKNGEMLLQKRAAHKYHSGGLWTNTCCSHPRPHTCYGVTDILPKTVRSLSEARAMFHQVQPENNVLKNETTTGAWACSGESVMEAASRRLKEEMGISCELKEVAHFIYKAPFENGLTEYEYDYVLFGTHDEDPILNKDEAEDFIWITPESLKKDTEEYPTRYTFWFRKLVNEILPSLKK